MCNPSIVLGEPLFSRPKPFAMLSQELEKVARDYSIEKEQDLEVTRGLIKGYATIEIFTTPTGKKTYVLEIEESNGLEGYKTNHTTRAINELDALTSLLAKKALPYYMGVSAIPNIDIPGGEGNIPVCFSYGFSDKDGVPYLIACIEYTGTGVLGKPYSSTEYFYTTIELVPDAQKNREVDEREFPACTLPQKPRASCPLANMFSKIKQEDNVNVIVDEGPLSFEDVLYKEAKQAAREISRDKWEDYLDQVMQAGRAISEEIRIRTTKNVLNLTNILQEKKENDMMYR